jgi:hypothetical protein
MSEHKGINIKALMAWKEKQELINSYIAKGEPIPEELTKTFIAFPLIENPKID